MTVMTKQFAGGAANAGTPIRMNAIHAIAASRLILMFPALSSAPIAPLPPSEIPDRSPAVDAPAQNAAQPTHADPALANTPPLPRARIHPAPAHARIPPAAIPAPPALRPHGPATAASSQHTTEQRESAQASP